MSTLLPFILLCFVLGNIYIYVRALQTIRSAPKWFKILFGLLFWLSAMSLFIVLATRNKNMPYLLPRIMFKVGSAWLAFTLYMSLALLVADILRLFFKRFKHGFIVALSITGGILLYGYINYINPKVNRMNIPISKPLAADTLTVVAVSDIHLGYGTGKRLLQKYVNMINAENPDIILIGGDLIDNSVVPLYQERMYEELNRLNAPMGIYMCPGNHEYFDGIDVAKEFISRTPIILLEDSTVTLPCGLQISGLKDLKAKDRMSFGKFLKTVDANKPLVIMEHQPSTRKYKEKHGVDLLFCGHTHNGQIWPGNHVVAGMTEIAYGYVKRGNTHIYVSSGLSLWGPPFRIGTDSELNVFKIYSIGK